MDNFYNDVRLSKSLLERETHTTGTLRSSRRLIPEEVKSAKLKKGEMIARYNENVSVQKWRDKREILFISTEHEGKLVSVKTKRGDVEKPMAIAEYNKYMGGVDRTDQMFSYYPCQRKTVRWNQKVGIHIFQLLFLNSYYLFRKLNNSKMTLYDFRLIIIDHLLRHKKNEDIPPLPSKKQHEPKKMDTHSQTQKRVKRRPCQMCTQNKKRTDTTYFCDECPNKPALCLNCFFKYKHK